MNHAKQIISVLPKNLSWWCKLVGITANAVQVGRVVGGGVGGEASRELFNGL